MKKTQAEEKLYFQDFPVNDYKDDYIGFEAEVEMIKESVESDSKIIGLISEYGSGKSSIIELLKKELDKDKYDVVNINLLDPEGITDDLEAHQRMLIQLANNKYGDKKSKKKLTYNTKKINLIYKYRDIKNKKKLTYITKRINPNYKSIDISTTNNLSLLGIIVSFLLFGIKFLYANGVLAYINFLPHSQYQNIINFIKAACNLSGLFGFVILFITLMQSELICNYLKNGDNQSINEFDLMEISKRLIDQNKVTVIVIEDLDRITDPAYIEKFIKEINLYYKSMNKCKFIIALTPKEFYEMSYSRKAEEVDNKYKPFNAVIDLGNIKHSDYGVILNELLLSKKEIFKKVLKIDIEQSLDSWCWLSFGANMNIRRLKHRINGVIHLYRTLINRFPDMYIELKTCIAITYLKDEYEKEYDELICNEKKEFKLKQNIEKYIKENISSDCLSGIEYDLYMLTKGGYIDYNCEMYCFNYSKYNKIFDVYEYELINALMYDRKIELNDTKVENIINSNPGCIEEILAKRISLNIGLPLNIFDSKPLINYLYNNNKDIINIMYKDLLPIDNEHINVTVSRINKIKGTEFFKEGNLKDYLQQASQELQDNGYIESIEQIRLKLLDAFASPLILKELYKNDYPIISKEEMKKIGNLSIAIELIDFNKIKLNNIQYIIEAVDNLYTDTDTEKDIIIDISANLNDDIIDYFFKNCRSLSKLRESDKERLLSDNNNKLNLTVLAEIEKVINNVNYSTEKFESLVIELLNSGSITITQYRDFVNNLPNVHMCTLKRIEKDDFIFETSELILKEFEKSKEYFGYVKCKTINDNDIPTNNKKYHSQYEALYSNKGFIFDEYIRNSTYFLKYISDNKIYEKYDNRKFMIMTNYQQTFELLNYAFTKLDDRQMLDDYISSINNVTCGKENLSKIIDDNKAKIELLSKEALNNFIKCCNDQSAKSRLVWIKRKKYA